MYRVITHPDALEQIEALPVAALTAYADLPPTFTTRVAREHGLHPRERYRLRDDGDLLELSRGVFRRADDPPPTGPICLPSRTGRR